MKHRLQGFWLITAIIGWLGLLPLQGLAGIKPYQTRSCPSTKKLRFEYPQNVKTVFPLSGQFSRFSGNAADDHDAAMERYRRASQPISSQSNNRFNDRSMFWVIVAIVLIPLALIQRAMKKSPESRAKAVNNINLARTGDATAQSSVGNAYLTGWGVEPSKADAFAYLSLSGLSVEADRSIFAKLIIDMTPPEIAEGEKRLAELRHAILKKDGVAPEIAKCARTEGSRNPAKTKSTDFEFCCHACGNLFNKAEESFDWFSRGVPTLKEPCCPKCKSTSFSSRHADEQMKQLIQRATAGDAIAQSDVGVAYLNGRGVELNLIEAFAYLSLAALTFEADRNRLSELVLHMKVHEIKEGQTRLNELQEGLSHQKMNNTGSPTTNASQVQETLPQRENEPIEIYGKNRGQASRQNPSPITSAVAGCAGAAGISLILVLLAAGAFGYVVLGFMELLSTGNHTMLDNIGLGR